MTIKEVCEKFGITADTLRYYEKVGAIPKVTRTSGGIRSFTDEDISWVHNAICFRNAGLSVEMIAEYVRLYQLGDSTMEERRNLLKNARELILIEKAKYDDALDRLNYKISKYEEACETGILNWDQKKKRRMKK